MPAYARRDIVNNDQIGVYHCIARCVRRAFLCGVDPYSGRNYNHRKEWVLDRLRVGPRASDQGFLPIDIKKYLMLLDWTGRELRKTSAAPSPITLLRSSIDWGSIDRIGCRRCATSAGCSSKRPVAGARSHVPHRAAQGAGSRAKRRLDLHFCRRPARC